MMTQAPSAAPAGLVQVARVLKNLAEASQFERGRDKRLRDALGSVLMEIGADALVMRVGIDSVLLSAFDYSLGFDRSRKDTYVAKVVEIANRIARKGVIYECFVDTETNTEHLFCFINFQFRTETGHTIEPAAQEFFCFVSGLRKDIQGQPIRHKRWSKIIRRESQKIFVNDLHRDAIESYCRAVQLAILRRAESDSIFPLKFSQQFWNIVDDLDPLSFRARPWDADSSGKADTVPTASLSFDLRQSTFAMDQAIDKKVHADWLEGMVIILRQITHLHEGVFDKFTGDGIISHFPVYFGDTNREVAANRVVLNSTVCAWDMVRAAVLSIDYLLANMALRKSSFGPSVGIAFDEAQWSVDRVGNPIVVGRGVVHACRLGGGPASTVQVSNAVFTRLRKLLPDAPGFEELEFVSKEYREGTGVQLTRLTVPPAGLGSDSRALRELVDRVFSR